MASARPIPTSYYYSGQGRLGIGTRNASSGQLDNVLFIGNVTSLTIDIGTQKFEHKESMSGSRATDVSINQEKNASFKFNSESLRLDLLELGLYGTRSTVGSGSVVGETHVVKKGYAIPLKHPNVSSVVVKKAGAPVTESGNWDRDDKFGTVYILAGSAALSDGDTVTIDYSYAARDKIEAFTQATAPERYLRFEGLNTVDGSFRMIEIPRGAFDPMTGMELINEELGGGEFSGSILPDLTIVNGDSQYFREHRWN